MTARRLRILGFWTLLGVVTSAQLYFAHRRFGAEPLTWGQAFGTGLAFWYLWGLAAPAVAWLGRRFQVDRANFSRHFFIHLGASLDWALVQLIGVVVVEEALHVATARPYAFTATLVDDFTLFYHWNVLIYWAIVSVVHALDYHGVVEAHAQSAAPEVGLAERLLVADNGRSVFVRTADVEWVEAARNYVRLHQGARAYLLRMTLAALETQLDRRRFRRVGRSALVNLDRVREIQPWFHGDAIAVLESGARVTVSRRYRQNLVAV